MTDESYGLMLTRQLEEGTVSVPWMAGNNFASYASWVTFTTLGCLLGNLLPDPQALGVDFALIAMFAAIFWGQVDNLKTRLPLKRLLLILTSVAATFLVLTTLMASSLAVLVATLVGCLVGVLTDE
jgi:predicted branched-subunit amino acid permease